MSEQMTVREQGQMTRRGQIEARIHDDLNRMGESFLDIGRCLNAAKDEGLVPHGEWQEWVQEHAKLSLRNAQRVMRAAREVDADSPLARLDFSKVQALLALPAAERESFAEEVKADELSVRELQAEIHARHEAEEALDLMNKQRLDVERALRKETRRRMEGEIAASNEINRLEQALAEKDGEAQARIDRMQAEMDDQERELRRRAQAERDAKEELLRLRAQVARGTGTGFGQLTPDDLANAARAFLGQVDVLPHMRLELSRLDQAARMAYVRQIDMIEAWCGRARDALRGVEVIENG